MTLPLSGYTVLDLTIARAGPVAVRLLADWGADVIRVEPPSQAAGGDVTGSRLGADSQNLHRNKRAITINLKSDQGQSVFYRLAEQADIVVENFRKDVKYRLGVDYDSLKAINPSLIYASVSGFGQSGPYSDRPGVDQVIQGMSGLMSVTGEPGTGPMRAGIAISDTSAGMFLGQGILMALLHREKTGEGQWVHTSLLESMLNKLDFQAARYTMQGEVAEQEGNNHPTNSPMGVFDTSDGQVNLAASTNKMFRALMHALGKDTLAIDPRFVTSSARLEHRQVLWQIINDLTQRYTTIDLVELANQAGCPCGPIYNIGEAFRDEHVVSLNMTKQAYSEELGGIELLRSPINMSRFASESTFERPGPMLGEHTQEILVDLGYTPEQIETMQSNGAI